jgi:hypothetical protein
MSLFFVRVNVGGEFIGDHGERLNEGTGVQVAAGLGGEKVRFAWRIGKTSAAEIRQRPESDSNRRITDFVRHSHAR